LKRHKHRFFPKAQAWIGQAWPEQHDEYCWTLEVQLLYLFLPICLLVLRDMYHIDFVSIMSHAYIYQNTIQNVQKSELRGSVNCGGTRLEPDVCAQVKSEWNILESKLA
jgi:hypothetical protein